MERFINHNEMGLRIGRQLLSKGMTVSTAESCTGGTIASMIAAVPGSSRYMKGGVVSYAVSVKEQVLGVILRDGVVSEDTAKQMALGVARVCGSDCAVATTGVAGPGPSEGQEQGTVCMAAVVSGGFISACRNQEGEQRSVFDFVDDEKWRVWTRTLRFEGDREDVILQAADAALRLLSDLIME